MLGGAIEDTRGDHGKNLGGYCCAAQVARCRQAACLIGQSRSCRKHSCRDGRVHESRTRALGRSDSRHWRKSRLEDSSITRNVFVAQYEADVVIVGAGTAGCVLVGRLSEDAGLRVLLLEAGGPGPQIWVCVAGGVEKTIGNPRLDWCISTEPVPAMKGRRMPLPR